MPLTDSSNPKPPRTDAQREAARRNGAKSKGPVTLEGKRISALNATRHGLRAGKPFVLENESAEDFEEFREAIVQRCQPADKLELDLCVEMAHARWRLHRTWAIETAMLDNKMTQQHEHLLEEWSPLDEGTRLSEAWTALANYGQGLSLLHRYEARLRRTFERALQNLEHLQRQRRQQAPASAKKMPNEPERPNRIIISSGPMDPHQPDPPSSALEDTPPVAAGVANRASTNDEGTYRMDFPAPLTLRFCIGSMRASPIAASGGFSSATDTAGQIWSDLTGPGPIRMMDYWTCFSKSGVNGGPMRAALEKGRSIFEAVVRNFVRFARKFERMDYHQKEWQS